VRSFAQAASKLADFQREFIDEVLLAPAIDRTGSPVRALEETSASRLRYRELGRDLARLLIERFVDDAVFRNLVQLTESALSEVGLDTLESRQTVVFVDVSDYTRLSEEKGDAESARQAVALSHSIHRLAGRHGGRMVKSLGDGAMVHAPGPRRGLAIAMDAVAMTESEGLWSLHAGVNSGSMVRRDGDYFGSAVNIAARIADEAGPGEVLVSRAVASQLDGSEFDFVPLGEKNLENVRNPVAVFRARRER
jgi:class 3 adenylate cyclase